MRSITKKGDIKATVERCLLAYKKSGTVACAVAAEENLLSAKVKFPLLEYAALLLVQTLSVEDHVIFCDAIAAQKTMGGNVLLGIILQNQLSTDFDKTIDQAMLYVEKGAQWYVSDIIGERVVGKGLLSQPKYGLNAVKRLSDHKSLWVIRSLGAGGHYAIKKGLAKNHVKVLFKHLINLSTTKERQVKQGIGWAAKTTAKFHPDIIEYYFDDYEQESTIPRWFKTKIKIGLERNKYAKKNSS